LIYIRTILKIYAPWGKGSISALLIWQSRNDAPVCARVSKRKAGSLNTNCWSILLAGHGFWYTWQLWTFTGLCYRSS